MRDVMSAVPGIEREYAIQRLNPAFRMVDLTCEISVAHGAQHDHPPGVQALEDGERDIDRSAS